MKTKTRNFKVRFNLAAGPRFGHWQITHNETKKVFYADPKEESLVLTNCFLRNQTATATKIHGGADKTVCAWIDCDEVEIIDKVMFCMGDFEVKYNPRVAPNWTSYGENCDECEYREITTMSKACWVSDAGPIEPSAPAGVSLAQ